VGGAIGLFIENQKSSIENEEVLIFKEEGQVEGKDGTGAVFALGIDTTAVGQDDEAA
jgi:hypothetical protein